MNQTQTWNQFVVKKGNKSLVLETIITSSPISRADIANRTGLNKGTVSSLVSELLEEELIYESGPGQSSGGRRPVMLLFNQQAGFSIGIDLGVNYLLGVLTDLQGNIKHEKRIQFHNLGYQEMKSELFAIIDYLISSATPSAYGIVGIGIGVPGIVNNAGKILIAPNLEWKNVELQSLLEKKYELPVVIENEANAGAYGEKKFGIGKAFDHIIYVSAGIGIGVGLILDGKLYRGSNGFSGEFGHMTIEVNGKKCRCGNEGCWELYASEQALLNNVKEAGINGLSTEDITLEHLNQLAENNDETTLHLFSKIGDYLGIGLNNIINIFNPQQVIIGNRLATSEKWLTDAVHQRIVNHTLWFQRENLQINFSDLSTHSSALGVAAFSVENFLAIDMQQM
ncbi:ROK family protein [Lentibacillus sp. N15]|uniref:ROK family protein n=1 Tax=Lentibacillus songyuanensis TaxID=3136161 RepID=UPI0031BA652D